MRKDGICPCCGEVASENLKETIACAACRRVPRLAVRFLRDRIRLTKAIAPVLLAALVAFGCAAKAQPNVAPLPFKIDPFDNAGYPWCSNVVLPYAGLKCIECAHKRSDYWPPRCNAYLVKTYGVVPTPTPTPSSTPEVQ